MDYFQGVVADYLRADRSTFVNSEFLLQLDDGASPERGRHWYCDIVAANFRESTVYLCEVTYSKTLHALIRRLSLWSEHWHELRAGIFRESSVPPEWSISPWVFIPMDRGSILAKKLATVTGIGSESHQMPYPKVTALEHVMPWRHDNHNRRSDSIWDIPEGCVICINNSDHPAALELYKLYRAMGDKEAAADGNIRVIDERGEEYLCSASCFAAIDTPAAVENSLQKTAA